MPKFKPGALLEVSTATGGLTTGIALCKGNTKKATERCYGILTYDEGDESNPYVMSTFGDPVRILHDNVFDMVWVDADLVLSRLRAACI